jgi:hypothetical protein
MKTALLSLLSAAALALALLAAGVFGAANLVATAFVLGLIVWTVVQYGRAPRPLGLVRPIRFPAPGDVRHVAVQVGRLAA